MALVRMINKPGKMVLFNDIFTPTIHQIGRWCIPKHPKYNETSTLIMDRSNEDHCGSCGNNLLTNNDDIHYYIMNNKNTLVVDKIFKDNEKYYFPFVI